MIGLCGRGHFSRSMGAKKGLLFSAHFCHTDRKCTNRSLRVSSGIPFGWVTEKYPTVPGAVFCMRWLVLLASSSLKVRAEISAACKGTCCLKGTENSPNDFDAHAGRLKFLADNPLTPNSFQPIKSRLGFLRLFFLVIKMTPTTPTHPKHTS